MPAEPTAMADPPLVARFPRRNYVALAATTAVIAWFYFLCAGQSSAHWTSREPNGYYNLLADAFLAGQLHLKLEPHPNLLQLPDPYDPVANAPYRVHDLTLYRGHYYVYYGVTPELLFYYPWARLRGTYLADAFVVAFCGAAGVGLVALAIGMLWRRHFPALRWPVPVLGLGAVGLGTMLPMLMQRPSFYAVPISCAFACAMAALVCLLCALGSSRPGGWLALASAAWGLAMGARPNFVLAGALVFVPVLAWWIWFAPGGRGSREGGWRRVPGLLACAYGPLTVAGLALLAYNYARFDSPFEFGVRYQLAGESQMHMVYYGPRWLLSGVVHYLFNPIHFTAYFPFVIPDGTVGVGLLWCMPAVWLTLGLAVPWWRTMPEAPRFGVSVASVAALGVANFVMVCLHFTRAERYMVDFQPALALAGVLGGISLWVWTGRSALLRRLVVMVFILAMTAGVVIGLGYGAARAAAPERLESLARVLDCPAGFLEGLFGRQHGPLDLEVTFPARLAEPSEALISAGITTGETDLICVEQAKPGQVRFRFYHTGVGGPVSEPVSIEPGKPCHLRVQFGAPLPPLAHPLYAGWDARTAWLARRAVWVEFEGRRVLSAVVAAHPARPGDLVIGGLRHRLNDPIAMKFSGRVRLVRREPLTAALFAEPALPTGRVLALTVALPFAQDVRHPLLATGRGQQGDLLYFECPAPGRIRFHFLHAGYGGPVSEELSYESGRLHVVRVWLGSFARGKSAPGYERLFVEFDGEVVFDQPQEFYPIGPAGIVFGRDTLKLGVTELLGNEQLLAVTPQLYETLPSPDWGQGYGAMRLSVLFPHAPRFDSEPLVVTGRSGVGDFVFVRYEAGGRVRFGADHWGIGASVGEPVEIDFDQPHTLEITLGSLYEQVAGQEGADKSLRARTEVRLDGRLVFADRLPANPSEASRITIGRNLIGGSSCGPQFSGKILEIERPARPGWLAP
jgi:hypothetical protein